MLPNQTPISRNKLFYSEEDFDFETDLVEGYIEEDLGQTVVLYEVDRQRTNMDSVYMESKKVIYKAPREIPCIYEIKQSELKTYDQKTSNGVYVVNGGLTFYVLVKTLEKYRCDINRGDYVAIQVDSGKLVYFSVVDDGRVNSANANYVGAYKPAWRTVTAAPVTNEEFNGQ